jgi:tetratricopeptide (TPR) repeat protein
MRLFDILRNRVDVMEERRDLEGLIYALNEDDERIRQGSARALGRLGDSKAIEPLNQALKDPDEGVKEEAITALGRIGNPKALPTLIQALESQEIGIRWRAAEALGKIGDPHAIEPLTQTLKDQDKGVKEEAVTALGRIKNSQALPTLIQALESQEIGIRWRAAEALGKIGDPHAIEPLTQTLKDPEKEVKEEATNALGRIALAPFISDLKSNDIGVRESAIISLNHIKDLKSEKFIEKPAPVKPVEKPAPAKHIEKPTDVLKKPSTSEPTEKPVTSAPTEPASAIEKPTTPAPTEPAGVEGRDKTVLIEQDKRKPFKAETLKSLDFDEKMDKFIRSAYYQYIKNFVKRSKYEYTDNFVKKSNYDYGFEDIQKMKNLLEFKGVKFTDQEILWLIQKEIEKQEYDDFKEKIRGEIKEDIISKQPQNLENYLENFIRYYPEPNPQQLQNLEKLLQENKQNTTNLTHKIEQTHKKIELKKFEETLKSISLDHEKAINIVIGFKKKSLKDKKDLLISKDDYKYIENFVNKCRYQYELGDITKMKDLLELKGIKIPEEEIQWIIQEEIKKQEYEEFKEKIMQNEPENLENYLENFIKNYPEPNPTQLQEMIRLLKENKESTVNLTQKIEQTRKKIELKEFENRIVHHPISETIPVIESKVIEDKAMRNSQIMYNLGNLFYDLGKPDEALEYYNKSISTYPEHMEAWRNKGLLFYIIGRPQKAAACYNHILSVDPNYLEAWIDLGLILFEMGKLREAKLCYHKALEINPLKKESSIARTKEFIQNNPLQRESFKKFLEMVYSDEISAESSELRSPLSRIIHEVNKQI